MNPNPTSTYWRNEARLFQGLRFQLSCFCRCLFSFREKIEETQFSIDQDTDGDVQRMEEGEVGFEADPGGVEDGQDDEGGLHFSHLLGEAGGKENCIFLCKITI